MFSVCNNALNDFSLGRENFIAYKSLLIHEATQNQCLGKMRAFLKESKVFKKD